MRDDGPGRAAATARGDIGALVSPSSSVGLGQAYRLVMTFAAGDDLVQEFAFIRTPGGSSDPSGGVHVQEESQTAE